MKKRIPEFTLEYWIRIGQFGWQPFGTGLFTNKDYDPDTYVTMENVESWIAHWNIILEILIHKVAQ